ncbi:hypothetical protein FFH90_021830 [Pseudomonas sp. ATCC 43928]|nr:hypothetical protein FFH90_021830 [Pseudomonas sp. ATCC 43928]
MQSATRHKNRIKKDCFWPIAALSNRQQSADSVEKVGFGFHAEKYAPEIEICLFGRRFRTRISRSSVQKRCFHPSIFERFGQTDFFNKIGQKPPFDMATKPEAIYSQRSAVQPQLQQFLT